MTNDEMYDYLTDVCGVSTETLSVVTSINGYNRETMEDILYVVTGYRTFEQAKGVTDEEDDDDE
jgi:hypothetical protein